MLQLGMKALVPCTSPYLCPVSRTVPVLRADMPYPRSRRSGHRRNPRNDRTPNDIRQDDPHMVRSLPFLCPYSLRELLMLRGRQYDIHPDFPLGPPQLMMAYTADSQIDQGLLAARDAYVPFLFLFPTH